MYLGENMQPSHGSVIFEAVHALSSVKALFVFFITFCIKHMWIWALYQPSNLDVDYQAL